MAEQRTAEAILAEEEKTAPIRNSSIDEKVDIKEEIDETKQEEEVFDPFIPFPESEVEEGRILSLRAILVGAILGGLVNASNVYLGLKTGWTFSANLFGAIFGYAILKSFSTTFAENFPILGGKFGPKENAIVQTTASAAGGLGGIFVSAIPALYHLKLLGKGPVEDFPRLLTFTIVCAYYGIFFATPLRKFFIINMAKELSLIFPTATATAFAIRSMHTVGGAAGNIAVKKSRALGYTFLVCIIWRVVSQYALGILWDWHIFTWFFVWGGYANQAIAFENWGWYFEWTPAFIGSGMLVGLNPAISFFAGNILAWGIIGPTLVRYGAAWGKPASADPKWEGYINFYSFGLDDPKNAPSPRYWLLWPGVMVMICASFAELGVQYKMIWQAMKSGFKGISGGIESVLEKFGKESAFLKKASQLNVDEQVKDPFPDEQQVKTWQWFIPLILTIIFTCLILGLQYHLSIGLSLLSIVLGFLFASLAIQCTGATDVTPLTTAAKASQLILGGVTAGQNIDIKTAQKLNLIGGAIASGAAGQSSDLVIDFRVGFLLRTPPNLQWYAQAIGSIVAMFLAPGVFVLFTKAYPCILDQDADICAFPAPSVSAWRAVAIAVTDPTFPVPNSSGIFSIVFGAFAVLVIIFRHYYLVGSRHKYRAYVPNFMAMGLAFVLPTTIYGNAMLVGALVAHFWAKRYPVNFDVYCYGVAAGAIAGEGLGGVVNAILQVADVAGNRYGTNIGCPGDAC